MLLFFVVVLGGGGRLPSTILKVGQINIGSTSKCSGGTQTHIEVVCWGKLI